MKELESVPNQIKRTNLLFVLHKLLKPAIKPYFTSVGKDFLYLFAFHYRVWILVIPNEMHWFKKLWRTVNTYS